MISAIGDIALPKSKLNPPRIRLSATKGAILLLAAIAAIGQFASNVYTPSLPFVAESLDVTSVEAQLTFAVFLASFAVAQLVYGPIADRIGRRPVLFVGLALFLAGTIACAIAPSLGMLIAARMVQAVGAAAGIVVSRAATRDSFDGIELTKTLAAVTIAFALVPGLTPLLGGVIQSLAGWRAIFWVTLCVGIAVTFWAAIRLPETLVTKSEAISVRTVAWNYTIILKDRIFRGYALTVAMVFGSMSAFFAASPQLFISHLGVGPAEYGLYPPLAVSGFIIGGIITRRLAGKISARRIARIGLVIMTVALAMMLIMPLVGFVHKHTFNGAMILNVTGLGVFLPTAIAGALQRFPDKAGSAASVQGFVQMSGGALGAFSVGLVQSKLPILAMPLTMLTAVLIAWIVFLTIGKEA